MSNRDAADAKENARTTHDPKLMNDLKRLNKPDRELPHELKDERIEDVAVVKSDDEVAFAITFEGERIPFGYWHPSPNGWTILDARITRRDPGGLRGILAGRTPRMQILVSKSVEQIREDSTLDGLNGGNNE